MADSREVDRARCGESFIRTGVCEGDIRIEDQSTPILCCCFSLGSLFCLGAKNTRETSSRTICVNYVHNNKVEERLIY